MSPPTPSRFFVGLILGVLSLLSAFLLFQVQPIISKFILPWFGGSPGVWTTCMLFFQVVLFAGYAYAHALNLLQRRRQTLIHGLLLGAAVALLPVSPGDHWKPVGEEEPSLRILLLLTASVGLPYFILSSTSPLVQVWYTRATHGSNPWRLYALSNLGSLAALLSYPLFFEARWDVMEQTTLWSAAFIVFVLLSIAALWQDRHQALQTVTTSEHEIAPACAPSWRRRLLWLLLPALASCVLLSATNHVCQDVAVIPFLWVIPLSLYLLTFIICFEHERWYARAPVLWALLALTTAFVACTEEPLQKLAAWTSLERLLRDHVQPLLNMLPGVKVNLSSIDLTPNYLWQLGWCFGALFFACMLCHGELTRLKPAPQRLTEFYLFMSAGGALGGLFVSLGAPRLLTTFAEWPASLVAIVVVVFFILTRAVWNVKKRAAEWALATALLALIAGVTWLFYRLGVISPDMLHARFAALPESTHFILLIVVPTVFILGCGLLLWRTLHRGCFRAALISLLILGILATVSVMMMCDLGFKNDERLERVRNFYGMLAVSDDEDLQTRDLVNGGIVHGKQSLNPTFRETPSTYYGHHTGIGLALDSLKDRPDARVGIVGMGAGTVACYAKAGQTFRFYDINPDVVRIAQKYFTYLDDARKRGARLETVTSDARLALEREPAQNFDVLLLDAFSGDAVPVHLLTREAFAIYRRHMRHDGIIAVHITNSYLVLAPVIEKIAADAGYQTTRIATETDGDHDSTDYVLVTNNAAFLAATPPSLVGDEVVLNHDVRLWTDRYHNLLHILDVPWNVKPASP